MESGKDRRRHHRLPLRLEVLCKKAGFSAAGVCSGKTLNISTGGMLVEVGEHEQDYQPDELLSIDMTVEPGEGTLEYGGKLSNYARILRIHTGPERGYNSSKARIAMQFCEPPKLNM